MIKFFSALVITSCIIAASVWALYDQHFIPSVPSFFFQTLAFLFFGTGIIYRYLYRSDKSLFIQLYLLTMVVKLIAYAGYSIVIVVYNTEGAPANMVFFMATYFIFTALEVSFLYQKVNR